MKIRDFKPVTNPRYKSPTMVNCIGTATMIHPNCVTYPSIKPFMYKVCNEGTGEFAAANMPYFGHRFIWSYTIRTHYENKHKEFWDADHAIFKGYIECESQGADSEKAIVLRKFLINLDDADTPS